MCVPSCCPSFYKATTQWGSCCNTCNLGDRQRSAHYSTLLPLLLLRSWVTLAHCSSSLDLTLCIPVCSFHMSFCPLDSCRWEWDQRPEQMQVQALVKPLPQLRCILLGGTWCAILSLHRKLTPISPCSHKSCTVPVVSPMPSHAAPMVFGLAVHSCLRCHAVGLVLPAQITLLAPPLQFPHPRGW
jgi:hypothetical protein